MTLCTHSDLDTSVFHSPTEEFRPGSDEMTRLMQESMIGGVVSHNVELTTTPSEDGGEFELIIPTPNVMDSLPEVRTEFPESISYILNYSSLFALTGRSHPARKQSLFVRWIGNCISCSKGT